LPNSSRTSRAGFPRPAAAECTAISSPPTACISREERRSTTARFPTARRRDYNPRSFLTSLIWNTRGERQCWQFGPGDNQELNWFTACDPNAQISVISGAWAVPLFHANRNFTDIRREAARLQKTEIAFMNILRSVHAKARVRIWTLADFIENPMEPLQTIIDEIGPRHGRRLTEAPRMADLTGFGQFLQNLRNQGMQPVVMGDFPAGETPPSPGRHGRPYLVK
jgi:hypothetical protein